MGVRIMRCKMHFDRLAKGRRRRRRRWWRRQDGGEDILLDAEVGGQVLPPLLPLLLLLLHGVGQPWQGWQLKPEEGSKVFSQPAQNSIDQILWN